MPHVAALWNEPQTTPRDELGDKVQVFADGRDGFRHLLTMRFALLNLLGFGFLAMFWAQGWLETLLAADRTYLVRGIAALFLFGLGVVALKIRKITSALDEVRAETPPAGGWAASHLVKIKALPPERRSSVEAALRLRLGQRIAATKHIANALVLLGLIGTVLGFMIALSGVDAQSVSDVKAVAPMVTTMIEGMSVALHTTLVGAALNLWLMANYRLLEGGATHLLARLLERGAKS